MNPIHPTHIAQICHEANRVYCEINGDFSQRPWADAPDWQKNSAVVGVMAVIKDPAITPAQLHESWMTQKIAEGWIYGPVKDADKKEHPCLVPYLELDPEQQRKDAIFGAVVRACLET